MFNFCFTTPYVHATYLTQNDRMKLLNLIWILRFVISGFPVMNDPLYNHVVFGPTKGKGGIVGKTDDQLIQVSFRMHNISHL